jgi:hypothetical protein
MEAHEQHDNHDHAAMPRPATPADCPVCYGELGTPDPVCPNGHQVCDTCRPHILAGLPSVYGGRLPPKCPICRHPLPQGPPAPPMAAGGGGAVDPALVQGAAAAHQAWVAQNAPGRNAQGRRVDHRNVGGLDAIGRAGGGRPHNGPIWDAARQRFLDHRDAGRIPPNSIFGGIHERKCGHRGCQRSGGAMGVRFLLYGDTGKRRYRCEEHTDG